MATQTLAYHTLDVFTTTPFTGNQLALVHVPASQPLTQAQKQTLTIEFNYSETVILHHPDPSNATPGEYTAQIFTPKSELPFAGHPTIGLATYIFNHLAPNRDEVTIHLKAGPVHACFDRARGIASAAIPHNIHVHGASAAWERVTASQPGLDTKESKLEQSRTPVVSLVPGMNFALVDLSAAPELLAKVVPTKNDIPGAADLDGVEAGEEGRKVAEAGLFGNVFYHIVPREDGVIEVKQRVMVIDLEDPATGAASATLGAYLALQRGGAGKTYKIEIEQGTEMGRESHIFVSVTLTADGKGVEKIELSGQAVEVMSGQIRIA